VAACDYPGQGMAGGFVKLYGYRVRIALDLKGVARQHAFVHLLRDGGGG